MARPPRSQQKAAASTAASGERQALNTHDASTDVPDRLYFRIGEVSAVGPVDYTRLVFATIIGFIWFGELPDAWTASGAALIVGSTAYIAHREAQLRKRARVAAPQA